MSFYRYEGVRHILEMEGNEFMATDHSLQCFDVLCQRHDLSQEAVEQLMLFFQEEFNTLRFEYEMANGFPSYRKAKFVTRSAKVEERDGEFHITVPFKFIDGK